MQRSQADTPLVTVIVPTIGRPDYVVDTLRSVIAQSYDNLQILISENAPIVPTSPLLEAAGIADPRIEIVRRRTRLAFSNHMNACIADARGTFLMILSDDDQISVDYVKELVTLHQAHPEVRVGFGRQIKITENDQGLILRRHGSQATEIIEGTDFLRGSLSGTLRTGLMTYISMFVRRHDLLRVGGFRPYPDGSHSDNFIVFTLALEGKVALAPSLMYYRVYLASFGLRTPFQALLEATQAYTKDTFALLERQSIRHEDRDSLRTLIKAGNTSMLLGRLFHVYRRRMSLPALIISTFRVFQFRVGRAAH
jgi:glycosyltransferase involved in cell wall biosynthesis